MNDICDGSIARVREGVARLPDVNASLGSGGTLLGQAARCGRTEIARSLLKAGAKPNYADMLFGRTPLHEAAEAGHAEIVRLLLDADAAVDQPTRAGVTALAVAAWNGHAKVGRMLLAAGAKPTPYIAAALGDAARLKTALADRSAFATPDPEDRPLVAWAAAAEDATTLRLVLEAGADVNAADRMGQTALHHAAALGRLVGVEFLLAHGARVDPPDQDDATPLSVAAWAGQTAICRILLDHGAAVNGCNAPLKGREPEPAPLLRAIDPAHSDTVRLLLDRGADIRVRDSAGRGVMNAAAAAFDAKLAEMLLAHGADPDTPDKEGHTPVLDSLYFYGKPDLALVMLRHGAKWTLHAAAALGDLGKLKELLDQGAPVNAGSWNGMAPLHWAARMDRPEAARFLLAHGARVDARDGFNETPLFQAAEAPSVAVATVLLAHGADVNATDDDHATALLRADGDNVEMTRLLLDHGAKWDVTDDLGQTPLACARAYGSRAVEQLLRSRGAK
jgi:ankyrin repeat protein